MVSFGTLASMRSSKHGDTNNLDDAVQFFYTVRIFAPKKMIVALSSGLGMSIL